MRQWTLEERKVQSELIRRWKPWRRSTGAKTAEGKAISKMNAYKHGGRRAEVKVIAKLITECKKEYTWIIDFF